MGDIPGGDYLEVETDGTIKYNGGTTVWEDMRTSPMAGDLSGARAPQLETVSNDGSATTGYAIDLDGSSGADIAYYSAMNTDTQTINLWIKPTDVDSAELLDRDTSGYFEFYIQSQDLKLKWANKTVTASGVISAGQTQMVTATCTPEGSNTRVKLYVNNNLVEEDVINAVIGTSSTDGYRFAEYFNGGWEYTGVVDGLYIYNVALTAAQIAELYNSGAGSTTHPAGITEATDVIAKFDFNENTGTVTDNNCTLGAGYDITLPSGTSWVAGLMGVSSGSIGIKALSFPAGQVTEVFGSVQFSHSYKEGSTIYPHIHWAGADTTGGNVEWGLEYVWTNIEDAFGTTSLATLTIANETSTASMHRATDVPTGGLSGTGKKISSILQYRLYRDGSNGNDTYAGKVYMSEFDVHYEVDTPAGSRNIWVK